MTIHRLFKELQQLDDTGRSLVWDALHYARECEKVCKDLGVKYTDKKLAKFIHARIKNNNGLVAASTQGPTKTVTLKQIEQVICGTNLDIIEEAARKKGLI